MRQSEIRESQIRDLIEKVRKKNYGSYLLSVVLKKLRHTDGIAIRFDFPVTALIGPNGSGKSTVMSAAACAYTGTDGSKVFANVVVGDPQKFQWEIEYDVVDKAVSTKDSLKYQVSIFKESHIETKRQKMIQRQVKFLGIDRTVAPMDSPQFMRKYLKGGATREAVDEINIDRIKESAEKLLGISTRGLRLLEIKFSKVKRRRDKSAPSVVNDNGRITAAMKEKKLNRSQMMFVWDKGAGEFSEFNFGTGEASILRLLLAIEGLKENSLLLIEEIENGLHPLAVERLVEHLIWIAETKKIQVIFTTHSESATNPLPSEAIWSIVEGKAFPGKLSVDSLRAFSGRIEKQLAIFVEDDFAKAWVEKIVEDKLRNKMDLIEIHAAEGDSNAVRMQSGFFNNPAANKNSVCLLDGDAGQNEDLNKFIRKLPGKCPESEVFNCVLAELDQNLAILTIAMQQNPAIQDKIGDAIREISRTNRDPHLLFMQVGLKIGMVSETIVRGAFIMVWLILNQDKSNEVADFIAKRIP